MKGGSLFFIIFCFLFHFGCTDKKKMAACKNFKQGEFTYKDKKTGNNVGVKRVLNWEEQVSADTMAFYGVTWVNPCEYRLCWATRSELKRGEANIRTQYVSIDKKNVIWKVRILKTGDDYYVAETIRKRTGVASIDTFRKINTTVGF
jgi:hypothetical protein